MKLPGDITGEEVAKSIQRFGYVITRQTGGHLRLTIVVEEEHNCP
jgi:predicted RNA binding protein YcfA (HicA-like mRNA interferase family)